MKTIIAASCKPKYNQCWFFKAPYKCVNYEALCNVVKAQLDQTVNTFVYFINLLCCTDALWVYSSALYFFLYFSTPAVSNRFKSKLKLNIAKG